MRRFDLVMSLVFLVIGLTSLGLAVARVVADMPWQNSLTIGFLTTYISSLLLERRSLRQSSRPEFTQ